MWIGGRWGESWIYRDRLDRSNNRQTVSQTDRQTDTHTQQDTWSHLYRSYRQCQIHTGHRPLDCCHLSLWRIRFYCLRKYVDRSLALGELTSRILRGAVRCSAGVWLDVMSLIVGRYYVVPTTVSAGAAWLSVI